VGVVIVVVIVTGGKQSQILGLAQYRITYNIVSNSSRASYFLIINLLNLLVPVKHWIRVYGQGKYSVLSSLVNLFRQEIVYIFFQDSFSLFQLTFGRLLWL